MAPPRVEILPDAAAVATAAATEIAQLVEQTTDSFSIALAGGSTPRALYEQLASEALRTRIPWERVQLFFGDERAVPPDHADSNYAMASRALLSKVDAQTHRMEAEHGHAREYEELLRRHVTARTGSMPALDLVLLGIGEDGHTASLFPNTTALLERTHAVVMNDVPQLATQRMTLTYPALNAARRVWLLVTGERKRDLVAELLSHTPGTPTADYPVQGVAPTRGELVWWLDRAAAARLPAG